MVRRLLFLIFLLPLLAEAQIPRRYYCEVLAYYPPFSYTLEILFDVGQARPYELGSPNPKMLLVGDDGKRLRFPTPVAALNYMAQRGWTLFQIYTTMKEGKTEDVHYVLYKEVVNETELWDGLLTSAEYKAANPKKKP